MAPKIAEIGTTGISAAWNENPAGLVSRSTRAVITNGYSNSIGGGISRASIEADSGVTLAGNSSLGAMSAGRIVLFRRSLVWCQIVTSSGLASGPYFNTIVACDPHTGQIMATTPRLSEGSDVPSNRRIECTSMWSGDSFDWQEPQRIIPPSVANASALNPASE